MNAETALAPLNVVELARLCGIEEASCRCISLPSHEGAHKCACGGSWAIDADGTFHVLTAPGSDPNWEGEDTSWMFDVLGGLPR